VLLGNNKNVQQNERFVFEHLKSGCHEFPFRYAHTHPGGGVLPYMGYIGMCRGIGYGFLRFSILK